MENQGRNWMLEIPPDPYCRRQHFSGVEGIRVELTSPTAEPWMALAAHILTNESKPHQIDAMDEMLAKGYVLDHFRHNRGFFGQVFEAISYTFAVHEVSRACTHQIVRTRIGAGFSHGTTRDGNICNFNFRIPETFIKYGLKPDFIRSVEAQRTMYIKALGAGVLPQDARFLIPQAMCSVITGTYNLSAVMNFCSKRMCHGMQWEINHVARLMKKAITNIHPEIGNMIKIFCERNRQCTCAIEKFEPCGLFPVPKSLASLYEKAPYQFPFNDNGSYLSGDYHEDAERIHPDDDNE